MLTTISCRPPDGLKVDPNFSPTYPKEYIPGVATSHGSNKNGGSYASEGGVGNGYNVNTVSTPYGTIYNPLLQGSKGGSGGSGGGYISIQTSIRSTIFVRAVTCRWSSTF
jgi:hypothetical protein